MSETIGAQMHRQRSTICGDLWPFNLKELSSLEVFERVLICIQTANDCADIFIRRAKDNDMQEWAAWNNAAQIYMDELRVRLGGIGEVFQNEPKQSK